MLRVSAMGKWVNLVSAMKADVRSGTEHSSGTGDSAVPQPGAQLLSGLLSGLLLGVNDGRGVTRLL